MFRFINVCVDINQNDKYLAIIISVGEVRV